MIAQNEIQCAGDLVSESRALRPETRKVVLFSRALRQELRDARNGLHETCAQTRKILAEAKKRRSER